MEQYFIKKHASAVVGWMLEKANSIGGLDHRLTKGQLRELFVADILDSFLTSQLDIGSGIIVNKKGRQSSQTDIIISDNRILPPFLREQSIGVYPAESVIATIEIKSELEKQDIIDTQSAAEKLHNEVFNHQEILYNEVDDSELLKPLCAVFGFDGSGADILNQENSWRQWLNENIKNLSAICLAKKYSWMKVNNNWALRGADINSHEEIKRFIAVLIDNIRTRSELRLNVMGLQHRDWLGEYIRDYGP
jgi:hypothetical protein